MPRPFPRPCPRRKNRPGIRDRHEANDTCRRHPGHRTYRLHRCLRPTSVGHHAVFESDPPFVKYFITLQFRSDTKIGIFAQMSSTRITDPPPFIPGFRIQNSRFGGVQYSGLKSQSSRLKVQNSRFKAQGSGLDLESGGQSGSDLFMDDPDPRATASPRLQPTRCPAPSFFSFVLPVRGLCRIGKHKRQPLRFGRNGPPSLRAGREEYARRRRSRLRSTVRMTTDGRDPPRQTRHGSISVCRTPRP